MKNFKTESFIQILANIYIDLLVLCYIVLTISVFNMVPASVLL
jgi:hypothetical protein